MNLSPNIEPGDADPDETREWLDSLASGLARVQLCSSRTTVHRIFHDERYQSHLLLPVICDAR
jgi:hypothetical protein